MFDFCVPSVEKSLSNSFMIFLSHLLSDKLIFFFGQISSCQDILCPYIDLLFLYKTNASFENCQKQVTGHLEKEQQHGEKLKIEWSNYAVFNVAVQGPFLVMIKEISSCNGCLHLSNVHLLKSNGSSSTERMLLL